MDFDHLPPEKQRIYRREIRSKKYVKVPGAGPYQVLQPKSWGSHQSRLVEVLLGGHGDPDIDKQVHLDAQGFDRIVTWIDINAPYYPEYASAYRDNRYGRSPLSPAQLRRLSELTGKNLNEQKFAAHVSFTRPEMSPCLAGLGGESNPAYQEAVAIIRAGGQQLAQRPRADMPGFQLVSPVEIEQQAKYQARLDIENAMRRSIVRGEKRYEFQPAGGE